MFFLVVIGWVFFRAETFSVAGDFLACMFVPTAGVVPDNVVTLGPLLAIAGYWAMIGRNSRKSNASRESGLAYRLVLAVAFGACLAAIASGQESPFLYFSSKKGSGWDGSARVLGRARVRGFIGLDSRGLW